MMRYPDRPEAKINVFADPDPKCSALPPDPSMTSLTLIRATSIAPVFRPEAALMAKNAMLMAAIDTAQA